MSDGTDHIQSMALTRYVGKFAGLYPSDDIQALYCDEIMDTVQDVFSTIPMTAESEEEKKTLREEFQNTKLVLYAKYIEGVIQSNGNGRMVCTTPSVADLIVRGMVDFVSSGMLDYIDPKFFDSYEGIMNTYHTIMDNKKVKSYYDMQDEKEKQK
jgi:hypothetical protein